MKITTLSSTPSIPFNDTFESFFDAYELEEDVECYQFVFCPYGTGTSFDDLYKLEFQSRVVIFSVIDFMIDKNDNTATEELQKFCAKYPETQFIIFNHHFNLKAEVQAPNLYLDTIMPTHFTENYKHCEKKDISNKWLSLNVDTKLHRVMTVSYLLSKEYSGNGNITFDMDTPALVRYNQYKNISKIPEHLKDDFAKGFARFKTKDFDLNLLNIPPFDRENIRVANNYNTNLMSVYENVGVEIITGTMFFERSSVLSEKEIQSVYAKNLPIYINGVGMAYEMKKFFGIDIFDDIVDHSYDDIEDHFERLAAAIDRNESLLDGSTNIQELWMDNQKRFDDNCKQMDAVIFDKTYQRTFNHEKIKNALTHFKVSFT